MDMALGGAKAVLAMTHIDYVVVFSQTFEEHLERFRITLDGMREAGLTVNQEKVHLAPARVKLLGFFVDRGTVRPSEDMLKSIVKHPPLYNEKSLP